jgi:hypothetical protein
MEWLEEAEPLSQFRIVRSEQINNDPGLARDGWIGIYRRAVDYDPRNLGVPPNNYEGEVIIDFVVQKTSMESGSDAEDELEEAVKEVLDRLVQIPRTYIDHFLDLSVEYTYLESDRVTLFFQGALITATAAVSFEVE